MGELVKTDQSSMLSIIEKVAMDPNCDVAKMEKMLDMQERIFNKNAEIEFNQAMTECQEEMPIIPATEANKQTQSLYAAYEGLIKLVKPIYTRHGFSLSFDEGKASKEGHMMVICEVMHKGGHVKIKTGEFPIDNAGIKGSVNKTGIHAAASTLSYAKRYLLKGVFNLAEGGEDDDATAAGGATYNDLFEFISCLRKNFFSISAVKTALLEDDIDTAAEAWHELSVDEKSILKRGSTRGGIFTPEEAKKIKEDPEKRFATRTEAP